MTKSQKHKYFGKLIQFKDGDFGIVLDVDRKPEGEVKPLYLVRWQNNNPTYTEVFEDAIITFMVNL